jgi:hypothetical protein
MTIKSAPRTGTPITGRIDEQFKEQPGMRLTDAQVRRLCHLSQDECRAALDEMVDRGRLVRDPSGRYRSRTGR